MAAPPQWPAPPAMNGAGAPNFWDFLNQPVGGPPHQAYGHEQHPAPPLLPAVAGGPPQQIVEVQ